MSEELKPCPFCGGEAEFERKGDSRRSTIVSCTCCGATQECGEEWGHGKTWNIRHIPDGFALVPVAPTQQQKHAAESEIANWCSSSRQSRHHQIADRVYRAMIAAAQAQQE